MSGWKGIELLLLKVFNVCHLTLCFTETCLLSLKAALNINTKIKDVEDAKGGVRMCAWGETESALVHMVHKKRPGPKVPLYKTA